MRTLIFGLAIVVSTFAIDTFAIDLAKAADAVPTFDIPANCGEETAGVVTGGSDACKRDETLAKNQLVQRWSTFGAAEKSSCITESSTGGEKSYVELLTCLEMSTGQFSTGESTGEGTGQSTGQSTGQKR